MIGIDLSFGDVMRWYEVIDLEDLRIDVCINLLWSGNIRKRKDNVKI